MGHQGQRRNVPKPVSVFAFLQIATDYLFFTLYILIEGFDICSREI